MTEQGKKTRESIDNEHRNLKYNIYRHIEKYGDIQTAKKPDFATGNCYNSKMTYVDSYVISCVI
ncbi:hypothetical protein [Oceanobacillus rekensis]|uniref:hypothetical protein n=1 Tax=Oceanobacillus rekensis TaxID=937927 RepID=UPI00111F7D99|nr:hypothetical protein [Oceanobacillus rekensis]